MNRHSIVHRALIANPGCAFVRDPADVYIRDVEVPSGGAVGTARGIARAYGVFACGGHELGLRSATLDLLAAPPIPPASGVFYDDFFRGDVRFALGFMKPGPVLSFGTDVRSYGAPGAGGAMGFADPTAGIGYAYVTSQMGTMLTGDPRDLALRHALSSALESL